MIEMPSEYLVSSTFAWLADFDAHFSAAASRFQSFSPAFAAIAVRRHARDDAEFTIENISYRDADIPTNRLENRMTILSHRAPNRLSFGDE
jgi:hypothetical protein